MDWESRYESGDTPWEKGAAAPPLLDWLGRNEIRGRVLVPGCGSGNEVRALAGAGAQPLGLDIAPSAVQRAESFPKIAAESYETGSFFDLRSELLGAFDWLVEHTCFCAIDLSLREAYVAAAAGALKPGGKLLAIFYLDPGHEEGPPFGVTREELDTLFLPRFEIVEEYVPTVSFPGREGRELVRLLRRRD